MRLGTCILYCPKPESVVFANRAYQRSLTDQSRFFGLKLVPVSKAGEEHERWRLRTMHDPSRLLIGVAISNSFECEWPGESHFVEADPQIVQGMLGAGISEMDLEWWFMLRGVEATCAV